MIRLLIKVGETNREQEFAQDTITIGRSPENAVVLADRKVSRSHARIENLGAGYRLSHQADGNRTLVNGRETVSWMLAQGDEIRLGDTILAVLQADLPAVAGAIHPIGIHLRRGSRRLDRVASTPLKTALKVAAGVGLAVALALGGVYLVEHSGTPPLPQAGRAAAQESARKPQAALPPLRADVESAEKVMRVRTLVEAAVRERRYREAYEALKTLSGVHDPAAIASLIKHVDEEVRRDFAAVDEAGKKLESEKWYGQAAKHYRTHASRFEGTEYYARLSGKPELLETRGRAEDEATAQSAPNPEAKARPEGATTAKETPNPAPAKREDSPEVLAFRFDREGLLFLKTYCISCHSGTTPKGGVSLAAFKVEADVQRDPKTWEKVLRQVRDGAMPPQKKPQPKPQERDLLVRWLARTMERNDYSGIPRDPGRVLVRRLTHTEYANTIRDLVGVDYKPAASFPGGGGIGSGFDTHAGTLFIQPILMERYIEAAGEILAQAKPDLIFVQRPANGLSARDAAVAVVNEFARRAFRRPVEKAEVARMMAIYDVAAKRGRPFEDSVKAVLKSILLSPNFLFRMERDQPLSGPYPIGHYEVASRLSYFLWSSMPDDELFRLAEEKRLHDPELLDAQVQRMLRDPKSQSFVGNFVSQWLDFQTFRTSVAPDPKKFPEFTASLRDSMIAEVLEFFRAVMLQNASLLDLLDSDYAYLNEDLARHYSIPGVQGSALRRESLQDPNRGGLLGTGFVLTLTSYPLRTSPVLRGKWVLEEILGDPPPEPPDDVPALPTDDAPKGGLTLRQQLERHRTKPECAACHTRIDSIGFALENFDPVGRWRTQAGNQPVDAAGVLPTGETVKSASELKQVVLKRKDEFIANFTEKVLSYAIGRNMESYDVPTIRKITEATSREGYKSNALIREIVRSFPFLNRRNDPVKGEAR